MTNLEKHHKEALCAAIRTSRYSRKVVTLLRDMSANLYRTDRENPWQEMEDSMDEELLNVFRDYLKEVNFENPMEGEEAFKQVIDYLGTVEEMNFVIPIHPNSDFLKKVHSWCAQNVNQEILLDFTTNRLMESGLIAVYKGHYFSYTLENLLDDYFNEHDLKKYFVSAGSNEKNAQEPVGSQAAQDGQ